MSEQHVTLLEVYRLCQRIEKQVNVTNGRVDALEKDAIRIKAFWSAGAVSFAVFGSYLKGKLGL